MSLTKEAARVVVTDNQDRQEKTKPNWGKRIAVGAGLAAGGLALNKFRSGGGFTAIGKAVRRGDSLSDAISAMGRAWDRGSSTSTSSTKEHLKGWAAAQRQARGNAHSKKIDSNYIFHGREGAPGPSIVRRSVDAVGRGAAQVAKEVRNAAGAPGRAMDNYVANNYGYNPART